jgi:glycogenin glucosyltransferase
MEAKINNKDSFSFVTLVSTDEYLIGALALNESLKKVGSTYPLTVMLSLNVDEKFERVLRNYDLNYVRLTSAIEVVNSNKDAEYVHWSNTFDKLFVFELTQFDKIVFLDSDMMVVNNIDHLFHKKNASAVVSDRIHDQFCCELNSGLLVIEPVNGILNRMSELIQVASSKLKNFGDQDIIRLYFGDWKEQKDLELDPGYNIYYPDLNTFIKRGYGLNSIKRIYVIHFVGAKKPWMFSIRKILRTLRRYNKSAFLKYLIIIFKIKVKLFFLKLFTLFKNAGS